MIVTIGNTKGGVGKSTLAFNFAVLRAAAGRCVWLINADRQKTQGKALKSRRERGLEAPFAHDQIIDDTALKHALATRAARFDDVIIDAGGRDTHVFRQALLMSDAVVVPWPCRSAELWELPDVAEIVTRALRHNAGLQVYACLNQADATGGDNWSALAAIHHYPVFRSNAAWRIVRRKAISDAMGRGLAVAEDRPRDAKAIAEIARLVQTVFADAGNMAVNP